MSVQRMLRMIMVSGLWLALFSLSTEAQTKVTSQPFGKLPDGTAVELYTLSDGPFEARISTYGRRRGFTEDARPRRQSGRCGAWI